MCSSEERINVPKEAAATRKGDEELNVSSIDRTIPDFRTSASSLEK